MHCLEFICQGFPIGFYRGCQRNIIIWRRRVFVLESGKIIWYTAMSRIVGYWFCHAHVRNQLVTVFVQENIFFVFFVWSSYLCVGLFELLQNPFVFSDFRPQMFNDGLIFLYFFFHLSVFLHHSTILSLHLILRMNQSYSLILEIPKHLQVWFHLTYP